jgi:hypothetical protein
MAYQTSYSATHAAAYAGMIATSLPYSLASGNVEAAAGVQFGKPVVVGTGDRNVKVPALSGDSKFLGVAVRSNDARLAVAADVDEYNRYDECAYLINGEVWVTVGENVADGDPVYFSALDGTWLKAAATDAHLIAGAMWMTTATNGNLAKLRLT